VAPLRPNVLPAGMLLLRTHPPWLKPRANPNPNPPWLKTLASTLACRLMARYGFQPSDDWLAAHSPVIPLAEADIEDAVEAQVRLGASGSACDRHCTEASVHTACLAHVPARM
jgi:hypothetical protein